MEKLKNKNSNGITLIALIITIIVMLILVGVTVTVALNGGLFQSADTATKQTQKEADREILQAAVIAAYDAKTEAISKETLRNELGAEWNVEGDEGGPYGVTSPKENLYTVTRTGKIAEGWVDNGDGTLIKGSETVEIGKTTYTNAEVLEKLGLTEYTGTYAGDWQVIGLEGDKLKLVSVNNVKENVELGKTDKDVYIKNEAGNPTTKLIDEIEDLNGDENYDLEIAMWSYEHAEEKLKRIVKETTGEIGEKGNARSITIEDINAISEITEEDKRTFDEQYGRTYRYFYNSGYIVNQYLDYNEIDTEAEDTEEEGWSKTDCGYGDKYFISNDKIVIDSNNQNNVVKLQHTNYTYKFTEKGLFAEKTDAFKSLTTGSYWLDSKSIECARMSASFNVRYVGSGWLSGSISGSRLFSSDGGASGYGYGVRAVVSI